MSYFAHDAVLADERTDDTVAPGVRVQRRSLLRLSAATIAAGLAACAAPGVRRPTEAGDPLLPGTAPFTGGDLDLTEFLTEMSPRTQAFIASGGQREEAYLMAVGELMTRLQPTTPAQTMTEMKAFREHGKASGRELELLVIMFALEPGKGFSHHDHRDYNGVILGVEGEARVTNYDILGDTLVPPAGATFQIRQTRDDVILPGRFSSLGTTRENVHEVTAGPNGATLLDVFTFLKPGARSYNLTVEATPRDPERRIYDASWA